MRTPYLLCLAMALGACAGSASEKAGTTSTAGQGTCKSCTTSGDCGGGVCSQFQGDTFCAEACPNGDECGSGSTCTPEPTYAGNKIGVCVPDNDACGVSMEPADAGASHDAGPINVNADGPVTGTVAGNGGTVSRLLFTVVGDTRPANEDDTGSYPTSIIDQIYTDIASMSPMPTFSLSTGDYQFANPSGSQSTVQLNLYLAARAKYPGTFFPAMGNHECTGATASNCGSSNSDGMTTNYKNFLGMLLAPIQKTSPYYAVNINAANGTWTSKFVFVAANAWDSGQSSWLSGVMAQPTTYTFVIRHESSNTSGPPGVSPSSAIINGFPYTLLVVGHSHTHGHPSTKEVLFGNGGAPLSGSGNYGYGLFSQRADGAITVDVIDYQTKQADSSFHFAITPSGTLTN